MNFLNVESKWNNLFIRRCFEIANHRYRYALFICLPHTLRVPFFIIITMRCEWICSPSYATGFNHQVNFSRCSRDLRGSPGLVSGSRPTPRLADRRELVPLPSWPFPLKKLQQRMDHYHNYGEYGQSYLGYHWHPKAIIGPRTEIRTTSAPDVSCPSPYNQLLCNCVSNYISQPGRKKCLKLQNTW